MSGLLRSRAEIGRIARRWRFWSRAIAKAAVKVPVSYTHLTLPTKA